MGIQIESGGGNGKTVDVTESQELKVHAVSVSEEHSSNIDYGSAYIWSFSDDPDANDDCIFYLKNNSEKHLVIEGITASVAGACQIYCQIRNTGTVSSGATEVDSVNLNTGYGNSSDTEAYHDGDMQAGATLIAGDEVYRHVFLAAIDSSYINFEMDVVITPGQVFTIWGNTAAVVLTAIVYGYEIIPTRG